MSNGSTTTSAQPLPAPAEMRDAWREACVRYRAERRLGKFDQPAYEAAVAAIVKIRSDLSEEEARQQAVNAISYASVAHTTWFWSGVGYETFP